MRSVPIVLDPAQQEELARIAEAEHRPVEGIVRELLAEGLARRRRPSAGKEQRLARLAEMAERHQQILARGGGIEESSQQIADRARELRDERIDELLAALEPHGRR